MLYNFHIIEKFYKFIFIFKFNGRGGGGGTNEAEGEKKNKENGPETRDAREQSSMPPTMTSPAWFLFPSSSGACGSCASTLRVFPAETRLTVYRWRGVRNHYVFFRTGCGSNR